MNFDSHVHRLLDAAVELVNALTSGEDGGRPVAVPTGPALRDAVTSAVTTPDYRPRPSLAECASLAEFAVPVRSVFEAAGRGDASAAAGAVNQLLRRTGARPQLNEDDDGSWHLHFHGVSDRFGPGWAAGIAAGLAMALGADEVGRLGVCAAGRCDRVYIDTSKNSRRQFCSTRCQNRVKAAAHRARSKASG
jgi:predicted RNA-binding Zn ribbon-like protein